ncbi:unnamed protein product, partial [Ectocarpus sp. 4 AP-2014]
FHRHLAAHGGGAVHRESSSSTDSNKQEKATQPASLSISHETKGVGGAHSLRGWTHCWSFAQPQQEQLPYPRNVLGKMRASA